MSLNKTFIFVIIFFFTISTSYAQNIAYANLDIIVKTSNVGKQIISYFDKKNQKIIKELNDKEKIIRDKEKSLISQKNILQEEDYLKKIEVMKKEIEEYNKNSKEYSRQIEEEKDKVSKLFLVEINKVLSDYAEKKQIDMIFSSSQMLIGKSSLDVTEDILKSVNKKITKFNIK